MKLNIFEKMFGSGLFSGYFPFASGTAGSAVALLIYMIPGFEHPYVIVPVTAACLYLGIKTGNRFEHVYGKDPSECTIDEFVGTWISLFLLPKKLTLLAAAFVIWRALDIIKPFPANSAENLEGGLGIMLDDVISGFYTFIIMQIIIHLNLWNF
jgi:phosphatidylglycerophosphatase A